MPETTQPLDIPGVIKGLTSIATTDERKRFLLAIPYDLLASIGRGLEINFHEIRDDKTHLLNQILERVNTPTFIFHFWAKIEVKAEPTQHDKVQFNYYYKIKRDDTRKDIKSGHFSTPQEAQSAAREKLKKVAEQELIRDITEDPDEQD